MKNKEITFSSIQEFINYTDQHSNDHEIRLYRGQEEACWELDSNLYRLLKVQKKVDDFYEIESQIFADFKTSLTTREPSPTHRTDWEILAIGQHYGLPTRLIDWTSNPLIALWFSFERMKTNTNDRAVWGLVVDEMNLVDFSKDKLFHGRFLKVFEPPRKDPRIIAQNAWFSIQNMQLIGNQGGDGLPKFNQYNIMNQMEGFKYHLIKMVFPNTSRADILTELDRNGINHSTVFPDLTGDCKRIQWKHLE